MSNPYALRNFCNMVERQRNDLLTALRLPMSNSVDCPELENARAVETRIVGEIKAQREKAR